MYQARTQFVWTLAAILAVQSVLAPSLTAGDLYKPFKLLKEPFDALHRKKPVTHKDDDIERLADEIDWLERHIDRFGSIVAKHPDVWGESRLMRHRYEYEQQMAAELGNFKVLSNAALRRNDEAFLSMALTLQAAASGDSAPQNGKDGKDGTDGADGTPGSPGPAGPAGTPGATGATGASGASGRNGRDGVLGGFATPDSSVSLEPTIQLDQLSRYINHLHELRRINEGDDIADSPGYSLNLVRIPVSVLPGKQTRKGYGAEITITAEPKLSDELLPATFRNLVINDLVDQISFPMTKVINSANEEVIEQLKAIAELHLANEIEQSSIADDSGSTEDASTDTTNSRSFRRKLGDYSAAAKKADTARAARKNITYEITDIETNIKKANKAADSAAAPVLQEMNANGIATVLTKSLSVSRVSSKSRRALLPVPPAQIYSVYDLHLLAHVAADVHASLNEHEANHNAMHLMDVQAFLEEELQSAYDFLTLPDNDNLWRCCGNI